MKKLYSNCVTLLALVGRLEKADIGDDLRADVDTSQYICLLQGFFFK